jgi:hypothetical protein
MDKTPFTKQSENKNTIFQFHPYFNIQSMGKAWGRFSCFQKDGKEAREPSPCLIELTPKKLEIISVFTQVTIFKLLERILLKTLQPSRALLKMRKLPLQVESN